MDELFFLIKKVFAKHYKQRTRNWTRKDRLQQINSGRTIWKVSLRTLLRFSFEYNK